MAEFAEAGSVISKRFAHWSIVSDILWAAIDHLPEGRIMVPLSLPSPLSVPVPFTLSRR